MNTLRFLTAGETHGPAEVAILEGVPAGLSLAQADIQEELEKRRGGAGRGGRGKIESDQVTILSGVRFGKTMGGPIALTVPNLDFSNWKGKMDVGDDPGVDKLGQRATTPRPGHADLAGALKYGLDDIRNVLERASARETVMRVAVGAICKKLLRAFGVRIASHTMQIGEIALAQSPLATHGQGPELMSRFEQIEKLYETDPDIRCLDSEISQKMKDLIRQATIDKNTLGGVIEVVAVGVPVGLGSYTHWDRKIDGQIAQALMSIHSVKAVELGDGIANAGKHGSAVHDAIYHEQGRGFFRKSNRAGGIEGGITNGEPIICRVYHKPISTLGEPMDTVDLLTKQPAKALIERSDICVVPRAGVVSESMLAYILAKAFLEKFGSDALEDIKINLANYKKSRS